MTMTTPDLEEGKRGNGNEIEALGMKKSKPLESRILSFPATENSEDDEASLEDSIVHRAENEHAMKHEFTKLDLLRIVGSAALLVVCIVMVIAALFEKQTRATGQYNLNPIIALFLLLFVLSWLAVIEGGLNCTVGLQAVDRNVFKDTHPITYRATTLASKNNLEKYIVGRQYMDLSMVFCISFLCTAIKGASVLGLPSIVIDIFLVSGWAMTNITIVFGQLVLQINSAECMVDYMNNYVVLFSTYMALLVETTGVCHSAYLIQIIAAKISGKKLLRNQERTSVQSFFFWLRVTISVMLLLFALSCTIAAIFRYDTKMYDGVPSWVSLVSLFGLILLVGMLDALQIAICAVAHIPGDTLAQYPRARRNSEYVRGKRLPNFLLGRQIGQTMVQFLLARITTINVKIGEEPNIFGLSDTVQKLLNGGLFGAVIATVLASLAWRILASNFPIFFLNTAISRPIIELCLFAERTGVIHVAWPLSRLHRKLARYNTDDAYLNAVNADCDNSFVLRDVAEETVDATAQPDSRPKPNKSTADLP